jgi:hypothetical protein
MPSPALLIVTVAVVGVLHTLVPDHWAPIAVIARSRGWTRARTARAAALAGFGHVGSTLVLGIAAWALGAVAAAHYGSLVTRVAALALIGFGAWIAIAAWREADHGRRRAGHAHLHRHEDGTQHLHWHEHPGDDWHAIDSDVAVLHAHTHDVTGRIALLFILGSSPMVEGLPAFFAASAYGASLLGAMAIVFAVSTTGTYVALSTLAHGGLERMSLGRLERYGEVLSGAFVACVGAAALFI